MSRVNSNSFSISVQTPEAGLPAYVSGLPPLTWQTVSGVQSFSDQSFSPKPPLGRYNSLFIPWSGPVTDSIRNRLVFVACGGHGDGSWNGVVSLDCNADLPIWVGEYDSTGGTNPPFTSGVNSVGDPLANHTYDAYAFHPLTGKVYMLHQPVNAGAPGTGADTIYSWDPINNYTQIVLDTGKSNTGMSASSSSAWDPVTDRLYLLPDGINGPAPTAGMMVFNPNDDSYYNTGENYLTPSFYPSMEAAGNHGLLVVLQRNGNLRVFDTSEINPTSLGNFTDIVPSNKPSTLPQGPDIAWHQASDAFIVHGNGSTIYKLQPNGGNWANYKTAGWSFTSITIGGATPDSHYGQGSFGKLGLFSWGNTTVLVTVAKETSVPHFCRINGGV